MKASLIIPCRNSALVLERCFECVRAQTAGDYEVIFVNDGSSDSTGEMLAAFAAGNPRAKVIVQEHRGVSAARNAALDVAQGEFVFFADPDDAFSPEMLAKGIAAMECDDADYCVFPYREKYVGEKDFHLSPLKGSCKYGSNEEVVSQHMSRMFGYGAGHVRKWHAGAPIDAHRIQGGVCWCVYKRELLERNHVRFDERIDLYEDAMFNCEYMLGVHRMTCIDEPLYDYIHISSGAVERLRRGEKELGNKLELLRKRKELDAMRGGTLTEMYSCSCVFSLLEMLKIVFTCRAPFGKGLSLVREYAKDAVVRKGLKEFPLSFRNPGVSIAVVLLRFVVSIVDRLSVK